MINHFIAVLKYFSQSNFKNKLYFHVFTDGRDTPTEKSKEFLDKLQTHINKYGTGQIATVCGRKYGMDRNRSWDRTQLAYNLITKGVGDRYTNYTEAIDTNYKQDITDEFIRPSVIVNTEVKPGDSIIHMNFRADRALQLTQAFIDKDFNNFARELIPNIFFSSMVEYRKDYPPDVIVPKQYISLPLGRIISSHGFKQLRIAESEKFPHVTYFFNGGASIRYESEDRIEIPSPNVPLYDATPEMSAAKLTDVLTSRINSDMYDFLLVNFANPDMVAHTGNLDASIQAIKAVDRYVEDLVRVFTSKGGVVIITADHGNAEELLNLDTGAMDTEHSLNPVPFILIGSRLPAQILPYGSLRDVAPTILQIMGITQPLEMTGKSLIRNSPTF